MFVIKGLILGKSLCSDKAFFYKMNNGCTKDLETLKRTYNLQKLNLENFWYYLSKAYMDCILNDEIFVDKFTYDERLDFAIDAYETIKAKFKLPPQKAEKKKLYQKIIDKIKGKKF